jgi:acetyl-CoA acetyltransferase family protein
MTGWRTVLNYDIAATTPDYYSSMGLTAEAVAQQYNISREDQDQFSFNSHQKAIAAIEGGKFKDQIVPVTVEEVYLQNNKRKTRSSIIDTDEGPRKDTTVDGLAKLKAVFAAKGSVTAGNSSQTSDGAAFVLVMSERMVKELNIEPIARLVTSAVVGCEPRIMGIGPVVAIPQALKQAGLKQEDIQMIELNEAFAAQSLAVIRTLGLNPDIINPNGGAIALGHPLGCSGAKLSVQLINEMRLQNKRYGMVSACIGGGQGIAGIIERLK